MNRRFERNKKENKQKTRDFAEVFTPIKWCNKMIDYVSENLNYDTVVIEITCGEAPFLVQRYDVITGEDIDIENSIGLLDRKLKMCYFISNTKEEWIDLAEKSVETTFGYDIQEENILISRENIIESYKDYCLYYFNEILNIERIIEIVNKNIFYFNGLEKLNSHYDIAIGNPPYQGENKRQIYPIFYLNTIESADKVCMVFPTGWQNATNYSGLKLMNTQEVKEDNHIVFIENRNDVFDVVRGDSSKNIMSSDVNIIYRDINYESGLNGLQYFKTENKKVKLKTTVEEEDKIPGLLELRKCVYKYPFFSSIEPMIFNGMVYGLYSDIIEKPDKYNSMEFTKEKVGEDDYIVVKKGWGSKPEYYFTSKNNPIVKDHSTRNKYKLFVANSWGNMAGEYLGGCFTDITIGKPNEICVLGFRPVGCFNTLEDAEKMLKYMYTKFFRSLLILNKRSHNSSGKDYRDIPIQDFDEDWWSGTVDEIDEKLFEKYSVPENIKNFIYENVQRKEYNGLIK